MDSLAPLTTIFGCCSRACFSGPLPTWPPSSAPMSKSTTAIPRASHPSLEARSTLTWPTPSISLRPPPIPLPPPLALAKAKRSYRSADVSTSSQVPSARSLPLHQPHQPRPSPRATTHSRQPVSGPASPSSLSHTSATHALPMASQNSPPSPTSCHAAARCALAAPRS